MFLAMNNQSGNSGRRGVNRFSDLQSDSDEEKDVIDTTEGTGRVEMTFDEQFRMDEGELAQIKNWRTHWT